MGGGDRIRALAVDRAEMGGLLWGKVASPREVFRAQLDPAREDEHIASLRQSLVRAKGETMAQVEGLDEAGLELAMPGLYQQIVATTVQLAAHLGLAVALSLDVMDELMYGVSISQFGRAVRDQMTETGVAMKRRHASPIAKLAAEVEAQRLAWRHTHEFLSWLAFRREEKFPAEGRRERLEAFKVQPRLLQCRDAVARLVGGPMAVALEGHDRFMLANRWRLAPGGEALVERYVWPILSYQPRQVALLETARYELDALEDSQAEMAAINAKRQEVVEMVQAQLEVALDQVPPGLAASGVDG